MASINGVTIKNLKTFRGHEWEEVAQGSIYLNGKRLGFWSQDSWGGPDTFDFDESILNEAVKNFKDGLPRDYKYLDIIDTTIFIGELLRLIDTEKYLKKDFKKGYKVAIVVSNRYCASSLATMVDYDNTALLTKYAKDIEEMKSEFRDADVHIFRPNDFDLTIDATHEAPTYFLTK